MKKEYKDIFNKCQSHFIEPFYQIPRSHLIFKQYSARLLEHFNHLYFTPISYEDQMFAHEQAYIRSVKKFEEKVNKYFLETSAYIELAENSFHDILN